MMGNIEPQERNQCVLLHLVAGAQWVRDGEKNSIPTLARVIAEAEEWRRTEHRQAKSALSGIGDCCGEYAAEIRSAAHDAIKGGHGRDYRSCALFFKELCLEAIYQ